VVLHHLCARADLHPAGDRDPWRLDAKVVLTFNQPMNRDSVASNFSLVGPVARSPGMASGARTIPCTPSRRLPAEPRGRLHRDAQRPGQSQGGAALGETFSAGVVTMTTLQVTNTEPAAGQPIDPYANLVLYFTAR